MSCTDLDHPGGVPRLCMGNRMFSKTTIGDVLCWEVDGAFSSGSRQQAYPPNHPKIFRAIPVGNRWQSKFHWTQRQEEIKLANIADRRCTSGSCAEAGCDCAKYVNPMLRSKVKAPKSAAIPRKSRNRKDFKTGELFPSPAGATGEQSTEMELLR